jgi:formylglycine-generating enzyme required for sulfatase activity
MRTYAAFLCFLCQFCFALPCSALITVRVKDTLNSPVVGAQVTFTSETDSKNSYSAITDTHGVCTIKLNPISVGTEHPKPFDLGQNYPNPFNPLTVIPFTVPREGNVSLTVYNALGQRVRTLVSGRVRAGSHTALWDGRDEWGNGAGAGLYFNRLVSGEDGRTRKMILLDGNQMMNTGKLPAPAASPFPLMTPAAETFSLSITGADIEPFARKGILLIDGNTYEYTVTRKKTVLHGIPFVSIPGGTFEMGDEKGDLLLNARPVHTVTLSPFQMSETEITNTQYAAYLNSALQSQEIQCEYDAVSAAKGDWTGQYLIVLSDHWDADTRVWITFSGNAFSAVSGHENQPVSYVSWYGAKLFAEHYGWDLPREAEWEYACRGGKQYLYGTDDGTIGKDKANYFADNTSPDHLMPVKSYPPNPFGLYDMSGNISEWCADFYGNYDAAPVKDPTGPSYGVTSVARGGGCGSSEHNCRSAYRAGYIPSYRLMYFGFRVVRR